MEFPITIESQEAFDGYVKDRLARATAPIAELKTRAETAEAAQAAAEQDRDAATTRATEAETKVAGFETKEQLATWRAEVAKTAGVPANALRGSTKEEFEAHAAELKPLLTALSGPVIPNQGATPSANASAQSDLEFANFLTGRQAD